MLPPVLTSALITIKWSMARNLYPAVSMQFMSKTWSPVKRETDGNPVWSGDNKTFYYVHNNPETLLTEKIIRHKVGTSGTDDKIVYTEKDPSNYISVWRSKSDQYIFITSQATMSSELRYTS